MATTNTFDKFTSNASLEKYLVDRAVKRYANLFGQPSNYYPYPVFAVDGGPVPIAAPTAVGTTRDTTNTQVQGVDEADRIETDGNYLYQVNGQTLTIVDVQDRANLKIASQFAVPSPWGFEAKPIALPTFTIGGPSGGWNNIDGMYLQGDRLTIVSTGWSPQPATVDSSSLITYPGWRNPGQPQVQVTVLDVADPSHVSILEVSVMEGNLVTSRAIGNEVFVVTSNNWELPPPLLIPNAVDNFVVPAIAGSVAIAAPADLIALPPYPYPRGTYETKEAYLERIKGQVLDLGLPNVITRDAYGDTVESGLLSPATSIYQPLNENPYQQLFNVSTFNVRDTHLGVDQVSGIPTEWNNNVFVSAENIYLLQQTYGLNGNTTKILQIDLDTSELIATGEVPGAIDDRFSVDEYEGFLRISTTTSFGTASRNNVYILDQVGPRLDVVGKLEGLAPGERIFSTRFQGDYGFVVTFRQVDPLFTIDLRDPKNPKVAGELKIPGFSEYLQVIEQDGKSLLLGVGRTADPITGRSGALKVSLFDVSNPNAPKEIESYVFPDQFSTSDALWDPKAITYVPDQRILAIPTRNYLTYPGEARLTVFSVDSLQGVDRIGEVSHDNDWINRSVSIRSDLYAVSANRISSYGVPGLAALGDIKWNAEKTPIDYIQFSVPAISANLLGDVPIKQSGMTIAANAAAEDLFGDRLNDVMNGGAGNDRLYGNGGNDILLGGLGDDEIYGASTNEWFDGGGGNDTFYLNGGADIVVLRDQDGSDSIHGFDVGKTKFGLANGLTFGDLSIRQADGFASIQVGDRQLARVNWVDAIGLNQASNFITV
jgi:Beta propeller domain/RTX calcium-binding nonapeptide repeat (4 copies)